MIDVFSKINADTSDPDQIALRSYMKGRFLEVFSQTDQSLPNWPGAKIVVYGSTLMRHLMFNDGISFPLSGIKSSDVDIGVMEAPFKRHSNFTDQLLKDVSPVIKRAISKTGFHFIDAKGKEVVNGDIDCLSNENFIGDFFVVKTFTPAEIRAISESTPYYKDLIGDIPKDPITVKLVFGVNDSPFPVLLNPSPAHSGGFLRARTLDMLAGKIVRSMTDKYKPTDLIDIYNLISGIRPNGERFLNFTPSDPANYIDVVRAMIVTYMPVSRGVYPDRDGLLNAFKERPIADFMDSVRGQVASNKWPLLEQHIPRMYAGINQLLATIMAKRSAISFGPLNLTPQENDFYYNVCGVQPVQATVSPARSAWRVPFLGVQFRAARDAVYQYKNETCVPVINVDLLQQVYPRAFEKFPELSDNIRGNAILNDRIDCERHNFEIGEPGADI